jgi:hypothetical protein
MSVINRILFKLSSYCRCRIINGPDKLPYLERYHLLRLPFGCQIYLHRFVASDPGRGLHNHPWQSACSFLLSGRYEEIRMADASEDNQLRSETIEAGSFNWINGREFHRINLIDDAECWTLFIHGAKAKSWGFLQQNEQRYAFHDHQEILQKPTNSQWWKTLAKPSQCPSMRKPLKPGT